MNTFALSIANWTCRTDAEVQTRAMQRANERATVEGEQSRTERRSKIPTINMNYTNLVQVAQICPDMTIAVKLNDLVEFGNILISNTKSELEQLITDQNAETYLSSNKVMEMIGVSTTTLWRWQKTGYLVPINVGGKRRYRKSDVMRIIEGDNTQKGATA